MTIVRLLIAALEVMAALLVIILVTWAIYRYVKNNRIVSPIAITLLTIGGLLATLVTLTIFFGFLFLDSYIFFTLPRKIVSDTGMPLTVARGLAAFAALPLALLIKSTLSLNSRTRTKGSAALWGLTGAYIIGSYFYTAGFYYSATGTPRKCYARTPVGIVFYEAPCDRVELRYGRPLKPVGDSGRCGNPVIVAYEWTRGHKKDEDSGKPIKFCERGPNGKLKAYENPFHPVSNEIISPCCAKDLLELELEELLGIKDEMRQTRKAALEAGARQKAPELWRQAEQAREGGEAALENKSFPEARLLLNQARSFYEEAKGASPSPLPTSSPRESIGRQIQEESTPPPSVQPAPIVPPVIVHTVQINLSEIVVNKDGGAGRWSFEILVDEQRITSLAPQTYHDSHDKKRVTLNRTFAVTIKGKDNFIFRVIGRSLDEGHIAEGNVNIRLSSFDEAGTLRQILPVTVLGKNKEGDFDFQLTFVKQ